MNPPRSNWCADTCRRSHDRYINLYLQELGQLIKHCCALMLSMLCCAGAMVFDIFQTWRLDSGDYSKYAEVVVSAWEGRLKQLTEGGRGPQGIPQQRPALMHSNLKDVDHVQQVAK